MKIVQYLREKLKPKIPEDVESDLEKTVQILINSEIQIKEIRLFGSLDKGMWNREKSDIDIYVLLDTNDERYSAFNKIVVSRLPDEDGGTYEIYDETTERKSLRNLVEGNSDLLFSEKYELHITTLEDDEKMWREDPYLKDPYFIFGEQNQKPFIINVRIGRLLYQKNET